MKQLKELAGIRKIHFVGIGGAGMSPLAKIMVELGYEVSGSDRSDSAVIRNLREMGATIYLGGQRAENVRGVDAIVVSTAIPYDNPEVLAARDLGIRKLHRSDITKTISAKNLDDKEARLLGVQPGSIAIVISSFTLDQHARPLEVSESIYPVGRNTFTLKLRT